MTFAIAQGAVVIDASATIRMLLGETAWLDLWAAWKRDGVMLLAPAHFRAEVANGLVRGTSHSTGVDAAELVRELHATGFEIADRGLPGIERSIGLAWRYTLTVYDAAYLDLAIDVDGSLATLDRDLRRAAEAEGVTVIP